MTTPNQLKQAARILRAASARRDKLLLDLRDQGYTLRQLASAAGLSPAGVKKILDRAGSEPG